MDIFKLGDKILELLEIVFGFWRGIAHTARYAVLQNAAAAFLTFANPFTSAFFSVAILFLNIIVISERIPL